VISLMPSIVPGFLEAGEGSCDPAGQQAIKFLPYLRYMAAS
jgi:hypothetical protein